MFLRKYKLYRLILQVLLFINSFLIFTGAVAAYKFYKTNDVPAEIMVGLGLALTVFGIVLPLYYLRKIEATLREWEAKTQKVISQWIATWVEAQEFYSSTEEFIYNPNFWINLALMTMESMEWDFKNPMLQFIAEMAPMIRKSLNEGRGPGKKKTKSS